MNESTIVAVHCYAGDAHQVTNAMGLYQHHGCPVVLLSPEDSGVQLPMTINRSGGSRAYTGMVSVERQARHLEILLEYDAEHYLLHDSDSVCLSPELPRYLYDEPDTVFYNACPTADYFKQLGVSWPVTTVFQPPLFCSRTSIEKMLAVYDEAVADLPEFGQLIDWWFEAAARRAGLATKPFPDGISRPIWQLYETARIYAMVRCRGVVFLHSVKDPEILDALHRAHQDWVVDPKGDELCARW